MRSLGQIHPGMEAKLKKIVPLDAIPFPFRECSTSFFASERQGQGFAPIAKENWVTLGSQ